LEAIKVLHGGYFDSMMVEVFISYIFSQWEIVKYQPHESLHKIMQSQNRIFWLLKLIESRQ
jgi:hypothetical protein